MAYPDPAHRLTPPLLLAAAATASLGWAGWRLNHAADLSGAVGWLAVLGGLGLVASVAWLWRRAAALQTALRDAQRIVAQAETQRQALLQAQQTAERARQLLSSSLDALDVGLEIYDEQDRLVLYNKRINLMHRNLHCPADIGQTFEQLVRANLARGLVTAAIGREEAWLAQRLATRGTRTEPLLQELAGDQWVHTYETRTPEGFLVAVRVDVTELVRKERALAEANDHLALQSLTDGLTGIGNRRHFDQTLATEWQRAMRSGTPLSLLLVDIDHFKPYNDHYGHIAGDDALRRMALVLSDCVRRAGEVVARYGGEEFVMLLPATDTVQAQTTAQNIMDRLQQEAMAHVASATAHQLTCSIGVATLQPALGEEPQVLIRAADAALYHAKSSGRARYSVAHASAALAPAPPAPQG